MASVTKVNPAATTVNYEVVGRDLTFFTVDYINDISGSTGPAGAHDAVLKSIMTMHTIVAAGPLLDTGSQQTFCIEGPLFTPNGGITLQAAIRALGTVDGVDLSNATVTETKLGVLTAAAVA